MGGRGAQNQSRMGSKQGAKMERVQKKDQVSMNSNSNNPQLNQKVRVNAAHDQTVRCDEDDDEGMLNIEDEEEEEEDVQESGISGAQMRNMAGDEERQYNNRRNQLNPPKAAVMIDREPEREPEL